MEDEALGLEAFALMGVPFGALDPAEMRAADEYRTRPLTTGGEKMMGAVAALEWTQSGGHVDEVVALSMRALEGGLLQERDPNLLTLAALLPMIVGDRDEALQIFDLAMADAHRRGSLFAITGMYLWRGFTLFWRGDLVDAEEQLAAAFDQAETWGYGADTLQWNAAHLAWCLVERGDLAGARRALARGPEMGGHSDGARYWCNARLELLVAEGRYEDAIEAADEYGERFARYHNPAAARWSSLKAVALDALGMKRKAVELAAEELDRARDWGAPGHGRALAAGARDARGRRRDRARSRRRSRSPAARRRGSSWPSRSPRSVSRAGAPAALTTPASRWCARTSWRRCAAPSACWRRSGPRCWPSAPTRSRQARAA